MGSSGSRRPWNEEEDAKLRLYVKRCGAGKWGEVQDKVGLNRSGKSCRDRWTNYLDPDIEKGDFSEEDKFLIRFLHHCYGNSWSTIASFFKGRPPQAIRNYFVRVHGHGAQAPASSSTKADNMELIDKNIELLASGDSGLLFEDNALASSVLAPDDTKGIEEFIKNLQCGDPVLQFNDNDDMELTDEIINLLSAGGDSRLLFDG